MDLTRRVDGPDLHLAAELRGGPAGVAAREGASRPRPTAGTGTSPHQAAGVPSLVTADLWPHPLTAEGRETLRIAAPPGATVATALAAALPVPPAEVAHAIAVTLDGEPVPAHAWSRTPVRSGQVLAARTALRGDLFEPANLLQIGIIVASLYVPGAIGLTGFAAAAASAAITIGGGLISQALFAPPTPVGGGGAPTARAPATVYSIAGAANRERPYEPMLLVLGRHRVYPDLAAREYTRFKDGDQYLYQRFSVGIGNIAISDIKIGDTPIGQYDDVDVGHYRAGTAPGLLGADVVTTPGADLVDTEWVVRRTPPGTHLVEIDLTAQVYRINQFPGPDDPIYGSRSVTVYIRPGAGGPIQSVTITSSSPDPIRRTVRVEADYPGVYDIHVRRRDAPADHERVYDDVSWAAMRSWRLPSIDRGADSLLAITIRATAQLSGRIDRLSALVDQRVSTWNGSTWSSARSPSSNPAALLRAFARGWRDRAGRLLAGSGRAATDIDDETLGAWYEWCAAHSPTLTCNLVLASATSPEQVEELIARCGRATISWHTGRLGVVWEDSETPPSALITPARVIAGTMRSDWASGELAEEVVVRYIEPSADWQYREVRRRMPGVTTPAYSSALTLEGVTSGEQAALMANLTAAAQLYHRRRLAWEMGPDGLAVARGDVVWLSHDLVAGGRVGRLERDAQHTRAALVLDRAVPLDAQSWLLLESPEGSLHQSAVSPAAGQMSPTARVTLTDPLTHAPAAVEGAGPQDWTWRLYAPDAPPLKVRIVEVAPLEGERVRIEAIDESAEYHAAATADLSVPLPPAHPPTVAVVGIAVGETLIRVGTGFAAELAIAVTVAGDWRGGDVYVTRGEHRRRVAWIPPGAADARWIEPPEGEITITVVPGSGAAPAGTALSRAYTPGATLALPPPAPTNFLIDVLGDGTRRLRWTPPTWAALAGILIRYVEGTDTATAWADMTPLHSGVLTASPLETVEPRLGSWVFAARAVDTWGRESETDTRIAATLGPQRSGDVVVWRCPSSEGWPGTIVGAARSDDAADALEGTPTYRWSDLTTWGAWESWGLGTRNGGARSISYATEAVDLGTSLSVSLRWEATTVGAVALDYRVAATEAALAAAAWTAYEASALVTGRWLQLRWTLTGDGTVALYLDHLCWSAHAPTSEVRHFDADTADWAGSTAAGRQIPAAALAVVTDVQVTLQDVGAGATWELVSKSPPTIRIYNGAGDAIDATVDAIVRGVRAT